MVVAILQGALDGRAEVRTAAEREINSGFSRQGFGIELAQIAFTPQVDLGLRQMAAVLLKKLINERWEPDAGEVGICDADKKTLKDRLPLGLGEGERRLRIAIAMDIAAIARFDWPDAWPELTSALINAVRERRTREYVHGALGCLSIMAEDLDEHTLPQMVRDLLPALPELCSASSDTTDGLQRRALSVVHGILSGLATMSGAYQREVRDLMAPLLPQWVAIFSSILSTPLTETGIEDWASKMEVLKCTIQLVQYFSKQLVPYATTLFGSCMSLFEQGLPLYVKMAVEQAAESEVLSDGDDINIESLVFQLFEVLITILSSPRYNDMLKTLLVPIMGCTIQYMQITGNQETAWELDPSQFATEEDEDSITPRASACLLIDSIMESFGPDAAVALMTGVRGHIDMASALQQKGSPLWWRLREAVLLAIGTASDELSAHAVNIFNAESVLDMVIAQDIVPESSPTHVRGRGLWLICRFIEKVAGTSRAQSITKVAVDCLQPKQDPILRVNACRAIGNLCEHLSPEVVKPYLGDICESLVHLMADAGEDLLHLVLETLSYVLKVDTSVAAAVMGQIAPIVLRGWSEYINDPLISSDALDVIAAFAEAPECRVGLHSFAVPAIASTLSGAESNGTMVEGVLDLLAILLKSSTEDLALATFQATFAPILRQIRNSDDDAVVQSCTECIRGFVRIGGESLVRWQVPDIQNNADAVCLALQDLLVGPRPDFASISVGPLISTMLLRMPSATVPYIPNLVQSAIARLQRCEHPAVEQNLMIMFIRLAATDALQSINLLSSIACGDKGTGLNVVLNAWVQWHGELQGAYTIKLSCIGLMKVLSTQDPRLTDLTVKGHEIVEDSSRIRTRASTRASGPARWTSVPVGVKILGLLLDSFNETREGGQGGLREVCAEAAGGALNQAGNGDDEWEEVDEEEDDDDFEEVDFFSGLAALRDQMDDIEIEEPDAKYDELDRLDLASELTTFLKNIVRSHGAALASFSSELSAAQLSAVEMLST